MGKKGKEILHQACLNKQYWGEGLLIYPETPVSRICVYSVLTHYHARKYEYQKLNLRALGSDFQSPNLWETLFC